MKRLLLLLLFAVPVYGATFTSNDYVNGDILPSQYSIVTVERERRLGSLTNDKLTCINENNNGFCELNEPRIGECFANICLWPTHSFKPWYSWRFRSANCPGLAVLTGHEYTPLLQWAGCEKGDTFWCCSPYAFPPLESGLVPKPGATAPGPSPTGALLVLDEQKWRALELGYFDYQRYEQRAFQSEKIRCAAGGGEIRIIDTKYGSFFADSRNFREGLRAFFITPDKVIPLITWCN